MTATRSMSKNGEDKETSWQLLGRPRKVKLGHLFTQDIGVPGNVT